MTRSIHDVARDLLFQGIAAETDEEAAFFGTALEQHFESYPETEVILKGTK